MTPTTPPEPAVAGGEMGTATPNPMYFVVDGTHCEFGDKTFYENCGNDLDICFTFATNTWVERGGREAFTVCTSNQPVVTFHETGTSPEIYL